jgi:hypothetical protein
MKVCEEMLKKIEIGENNIPRYLDDFFSKYKKELEELSKKIESGEIKPNNFIERVKRFSLCFGEFLENNNWKVYPQVSLREPNNLPKDIFKNQETCSLVKIKFPSDLKHIYNKMKKIDFIAIQRQNKQVLFIEIKIYSELPKFFDAFLEFSMINTTILNDKYTKSFVVLSDYGGNIGQKNRPMELNNEFEFIRDVFKRSRLFIEEKVYFILLDPEFLQMTIDTLNQVILQNSISV